MKTRPWPIVLLALVRILSPISSIFLNAWFIQMNPGLYLYRFLTKGELFNQIDFFVLPVVSGIAVYAMKKWSYPVFLSISAWTLFTNANFVMQVRNTPGIWWVISLFILDFGFVSYFLLLSTVRKMYFDSRLRWWEQKPRYIVELDGELQKDPMSKPMQCSILDISEGGILIKTKDSFVMHEPVQLSFTCFHLPIRVKAVPVHYEPSMNRYGFQFTDIPRSERSNLKRLVKALSILQAPLRSTKKSKFSDFMAWAKLLVTQGKGWAPELASSSTVGTKPQGAAASASGPAKPRLSVVIGPGTTAKRRKPRRPSSRAAAKPKRTVA